MMKRLLAFGILGLIGGLVLAFSLKPIYGGDAVVLVDPRAADGVPIDPNGPLRALVAAQTRQNVGPMAKELVDPALLASAREAAGLAPATFTVVSAHAGA